MHFYGVVEDYVGDKNKQKIDIKCRFSSEVYKVLIKKKNKKFPMEAWLSIFPLAILAVFAWLPVNQGRQTMGNVDLSSTSTPLIQLNQPVGQSWKQKQILHSRKSLKTLEDLLKLTDKAETNHNTGKQRYTKKIVSKINICYDRFKRCASELSPAFCGGFGQNVTFYIWARQWADYILQSSDPYRNVKCSQGLLKIFAQTFYRA